MVDLRRVFDPELLAQSGLLGPQVDPAVQDEDLPAQRPGLLS